MLVKMEQDEDSKEEIIPPRNEKECSLEYQGDSDEDNLDGHYDLNAPEVQPRRVKSNHSFQLRSMDHDDNNRSACFCCL